MTPSTTDAFDRLVAAALDRLDEMKAVRGVLQRDGNTIGKLAVGRQLGWINHMSRMRDRLEQLTVLARVTERQGYDRVLVLGGDSVWPSVVGQHLQGRRGLKLRHAGDAIALPASLAWAQQGRPLFVVIGDADWPATHALYLSYRAHFDRGADFVGVGPHGSEVAALAEAAGFREFFQEVSELCGPMSATGLAGLVPAVLAGVVITDALARIEESLEQSLELIAARNPAAQLAAFLAAAESSGRWQLHLRLSKDVSAFGAWITQMLAASAGPEGSELFTLTGGDAIQTASDEGRLTHAAAVGLSTFADPDAPGLAELEDAGVPSHAVVMPSPEDLWSEAVRWQMAVVLLAMLRADRQRDVDTTATRLEVATAPETIRVASIKAIAGGIQSALAAGTASEVLAVVAFVPPSEANQHRLGALQTRLQGRTASTVDVAFGPRDVSAMAPRDNVSRGRVVIVVADAPDDAATADALRAAASLAANGHQVITAVVG